MYQFNDLYNHHIRAHVIHPHRGQFAVDVSSSESDILKRCMLTVYLVTDMPDAYCILLRMPPGRPERLHKCRAPRSELAKLLATTFLQTI